MSRGREQRGFARAIGMALALGLCAATTAAVRAGEDRMRLDDDRTLVVRTPFEMVPPDGMVSVDLRLVNGSKGPSEEWVTVSAGYGDQGISTRCEVRAGAGAEGNLRVYAVLPWKAYAGALSLRTGAGARQFLGAAGGGGSTRPYVGATALAHGKMWAELEKVMRASDPASRGPSVPAVMGGRVDLAEIGDDWRGLSGVAHLMVTEEEWRALPATTRDAVLDWVGFGGWLHRVDAKESGFEEVGLGRIGRGFPMGDKEWLSRFKDRDSLAARTTADRFKWQGAVDVGKPGVNAWLLSAVVLGFAIFIGPVNLLVWARRDRRHRMLVTTPLISLAAAGILVGTALLQDGLGGAGRTSILLMLQPERHRTLVLQEQASRTGLLLRTGFEVKETALVLPKNERGRDGMSIDGKRFDGDWFASRQTQAQVLALSRPGREEITLVNAEAVGRGAAPEVLSSIGSELAEVYWKDDKPISTLWKARGVRPGVKATLTRTDGQSPDLVEVGPVVKKAVESALREPGHVVAISAEPSKAAVVTHRDIRWTHAAYYVGELKSGP